MIMSEFPVRNGDKSQGRISGHLMSLFIVLLFLPEADGVFVVNFRHQAKASNKERHRTILVLTSTVQAKLCISMLYGAAFEMLWTSRVE